MKKISFPSLMLLLVIIASGCGQGNENGKDPEPAISVKWNLETNNDDQTHQAWFEIRNSGDNDLNDDWTLYWNMAPREIDQSSIDANVEIKWINGDYYKMVPREGFNVKPGDSVRIGYIGSDWMIKESDAPTGIYMIKNELVVPINDYRIMSFQAPAEINRTSADLEPIPTSEFVYDQNLRISALDRDKVIPVMPTPSTLELGMDSVSINAQTVIQHVAGAETEAALITSELNNMLQGVLTVKEGNSPGNGKIQLIIDQMDTEGAYELNVSNENGILIRGDRAGLFYGTRSLLQLIPPQQLSGNQEEIDIPEIHIEDKPAFDYRGFFIDVSRNFNSIETLKRVVDVMALYKLNKFHIHLTEDEAWRIEIEELPELTEYGSVRGHTENEDFHLPPAYGSGSDTESPPGSGYYTREQFKDLIKYAYDRHIQVIPEFNVPGHSRAAIMSMEYRYRKYMAQEEPEEAEKYRLADPEDVSEYRSAQWYTDNTTCVCQESSFRFVTTVIDDIVEMYEEAGVPIEIFHVGGDEVPVGAWTESPICQEFMRNHPEIENERNLQAYFFRRVNNHLREKEIKTGGWEEVAQTFNADGSWTVNREFADGQVIPYIWNSLWGAEDLGYRMANAGYPVVLCNVTNFYFDLAYNKDPREPGLYWGGFVDTHDAWSFVPFDMFQSIHVSAMGEPYTPEDFIGKERLTPEGRQNILGMQAQLWSETIKGRDMVEYYVLPKLLGLAERTWNGTPGWSADYPDTESREEAWNAFANRIGQFELPRLDYFNNGYNYRLPPPGAIVQNGELLANVLYPGLDIHYTLDGTEPSSDSPLYTGPVKVQGGNIKLVTVDNRGRTSLITELKSDNL